MRKLSAVTISVLAALFITAFLLAITPRASERPHYLFLDKEYPVEKVNNCAIPAAVTVVTPSLPAPQISFDKKAVAQAIPVGDFPTNLADLNAANRPIATVYEDGDHLVRVTAGFRSVAALSTGYVAFRFTLILPDSSTTVLGDRIDPYTVGVVTPFPITNPSSAFDFSVKMGLLIGNYQLRVDGVSRDIGGTPVCIWTSLEIVRLHPIP